MSELHSIISSAEMHTFIGEGKIVTISCRNPKRRSWKVHANLLAKRSSWWQEAIKRHHEAPIYFDDGIGIDIFVQYVYSEHIPLQDKDCDEDEHDRNETALVHLFAFCVETEDEDAAHAAMVAVIDNCVTGVYGEEDTIYPLHYPNLTFIHQKMSVSRKKFEGMWNLLVDLAIWSNSLDMLEHIADRQTMIAIGNTAITVARQGLRKGRQGWKIVTCCNYLEPWTDGRHCVHQRQPEGDLQRVRSPNELEGHSMNKNGYVLNDDGVPIGELVSGDLLACTGKKINATGRVLDNKGTIIGRARVHPWVMSKE